MRLQYPFLRNIQFVLLMLCVFKLGGYRADDTYISFYNPNYSGIRATLEKISLQHATAIRYRKSLSTSVRGCEHHLTVKRRLLTIWIFVGLNSFIYPIYHRTEARSSHPDFRPPFLLEEGCGKKDLNGGYSTVDFRSSSNYISGPCVDCQVLASGVKILL